MRKVISEPSFLGSTDIGAIELDAKSRDDIPAILIGLQAVYLDEETRTELDHVSKVLQNVFTEDWSWQVHWFRYQPSPEQERTTP